MQSNTTRSATALGAILLLGLAGHSQRTAAHSGHANQAIHGSRDQLTKVWTRDEVQVFDREQGRMYVLAVKKGEAYFMDPLRGIAVMYSVVPGIGLLLGGLLLFAFPLNRASQAATRAVLDRRRQAAA